MSTMRAGADEKEAPDANCCVESAVVRIEHALDQIRPLSKGHSPIHCVIPPLFSSSTGESAALLQGGNASHDDGQDETLRSHSADGR
jgi:hypothetical protein